MSRELDEMCIAEVFGGCKQIGDKFLPTEAVYGYLQAACSSLDLLEDADVRFLVEALQECINNEVNIKVAIVKSYARFAMYDQMAKAN